MTDPLRLASLPAEPVRVSSDIPHRLADLEIVRGLAVARLRVILGILGIAGGPLDDTARQILRDECDCVLAALEELDVFRAAPLAEPA